MIFSGPRMRWFFEATRRRLDSRTLCSPDYVRLYTLELYSGEISKTYLTMDTTIAFGSITLRRQLACQAGETSQGGHEKQRGRNIE